MQHIDWNHPTPRTGWREAIDRLVSHLPKEEPYRPVPNGSLCSDLRLAASSSEVTTLTGGEVAASATELSRA